MKKFIVLAIFIFYSFRVNCAIGCMDNSYHMKKPCDFKEFHYVQCDCPCRNVTEQWGICRRCYHYGNPERGMINSLQGIPDIVLR